MAEGVTFDIPSLAKEEILEWLHGGMLGDGATNILQEHLEHPTPALMMQLCLSILSKHGIDERTLTQPFDGVLTSVKYPELYVNTFKLVNVSIAIKNLIPTLGKEIVLTDFTTPRPRRLQKFICACINYFKSWENNVRVFEEKYSVIELEVKKSQQIQIEKERLQKETAELKEWLSENRPRIPQLKKEVEELKKEKKQYMTIKEEKEQWKVEAKKKYQQDLDTLEKLQGIRSGLEAEKENLMQKVVSSPNRHMERRNKVTQKLKVIEERQAEVLANLREAEKKSSMIESMSQLLVDVTQTLGDITEMQENAKKLRSKNQSGEFEIERSKLSTVELGQNIDNLKHRFTTRQEGISRANLRRNQRRAEFEQTREDLERKKNSVNVAAGRIDKEVTKIEKESEQYRKLKLQKEEELENFVSQVEVQKKRLMAKMDNYMTNAQEQLCTCPDAQLPSKLKTIYGEYVD